MVVSFILLNNDLMDLEYKEVAYFIYWTYLKFEDGVTQKNKNRHNYVLYVKRYIYNLTIIMLNQFKPILREQLDIEAAPIHTLATSSKSKLYTGIG